MSGIDIVARVNKTHQSGKQNVRSTKENGAAGNIAAPSLSPGERSGDQNFKVTPA
jgi:hypothetical protein